MCIAAVVLGIQFRLSGVASRSLEYDEIWTLERYADAAGMGGIFTELSVPNNHPLHSLLVRLAVSWFGRDPVVIRLPALVPGVLLIVVVGCFTLAVSRDGLACFLATVLAGFNGALIHYSQTSRGYMLQALLITGMALCLVLEVQRTGPRLMCYLCPVAAAVFAVGAVLTLPTSILFILPAYAVHAIAAYRRWVREGGEDATTGRCRRLLRFMWRRYCCAGLSFLSFAVFCAIWYAANLQQFRAGQSFGIPVDSVVGWAVFAVSTVRQLVAWPLLLAPLLLFVRKETRPHFAMLFAVACVPLVSAAVLRAGPARVYLPLTPFLLAGAAVGLAAAISRLSSQAFRTLAGLCILALVTAVSAATAQQRRQRWRPVDWAVAFREIQDAVPQDAYICYPAAAGYALAYNVPWATVDTHRRHLRLHGDFVQIGHTHAISALNATTGRTVHLMPWESIRPVPLILDECRAYVYWLQPLDRSGANAASNILVLSVGPGPVEAVEQIKFRFLGRPDTPWMLLNRWLTAPQRTADGTEVMAAVLATDNPGMTLDEMRELQQISHGFVTFYQLLPGRKIAPPPLE